MNGHAWVLCADDNEAVLALELDVLGSDARLWPEGVSDGEAALHRMLALRPAVAVLDGHMPGLNGLDVGRRFRAAAPEARTAILVTSAQVEALNDAVVQAAGGNRFLAKPFTPVGLSAAVMDLLRQRSYASTDGTRRGATYQIAPLNNLLD